MFQSLIGELKTKLEVRNLYLKEEFQSLIGELKTFFIIYKVIVIIMFQSLIGELKTKKLFNYCPMFI